MINHSIRSIRLLSSPKTVASEAGRVPPPAGGRRAPCAPKAKEQAARGVMSTGRADKSVVRGGRRLAGGLCAAGGKVYPDTGGVEQRVYQNRRHESPGAFVAVAQHQGQHEERGGSGLGLIFPRVRRANRELRIVLLEAQDRIGSSERPRAVVGMSLSEIRDNMTMDSTRLLSRTFLSLRLAKLASVRHRDDHLNVRRDNS